MWHSHNSLRYQSDVRSRRSDPKYAELFHGAIVLTNQERAIFALLARDILQNVVICLQPFTNMAGGQPQLHDL